MFDHATFYFTGPKGIAVNRSGHLVVVDNRASCIFVFQSNGKLVQKFGSRGSEAGKLAGPHFVAIDSQDHIIVSDFHNHSIKVSKVHLYSVILKKSCITIKLSNTFKGI